MSLIFILYNIISIKTMAKKVVHTPIIPQSTQKVKNLKFDCVTSQVPFSMPPHIFMFPRISGERNNSSNGTITDPFSSGEAAGPRDQLYIHVATVQPYPQVFPVIQSCTLNMHHYNRTNYAQAQEDIAGWGGG